MLTKRQVKHRTERGVFLGPDVSYTRPRAKAACRVNGAQLVTPWVEGKYGHEVAEDLHALVVALQWPPRAFTPAGYNKRPAHIDRPKQIYTAVADAMEAMWSKVTFERRELDRLERQAAMMGGMSFERLKTYAREHYGVQIEEFIHDSFIGKPIPGSVPVGAITQCQPKEKKP